MASIKTKDIDIPEETINSWQKMLNFVAEITGVTASLIMEVDPPYMEVVRSSQSEDNPYNIGDKEKLPGLYCEEVIKSDQKLMVPNALKDDKWKNNPDIELGMISYLGFPIKWPDGDFFGTICILDTEENKFSDKTETLLKEFKEFIESHLKNIYQKQEFKKSENKFRTILNSIGDGVITTDENLRIEIMNPTAEKLTGYKLKEVKGKKLEEIFDLIHSVTGESQDIPMEKVLMKGKTINLSPDTTLIDKKGQRYQIKDSTAPIQESEEEIKGAVIVFSNVSKDILTGVYTHSYMKETIRKLDDKKNLPLSIVLADINGLKIINDTYGYRIGNDLIIKTAKILQKYISKEDLLARWAGGQFVLLLPQTSKNKAQKIIKKIKNRNKKLNKKNIPISIGMGVATKDNLNEDINSILEKADDNMYQNKLSESRSDSNKIVQTLLNTLGTKSSETKEHAIRMTNLAHKLGEKLKLSNSELNKLSLLATLHDIGKTTISEDILTKPGNLTDEEWEIMRKHPERGYKIASASEEFILVTKEILSHHEKWNGNGYPRGLKGEDIPYLARIISIIDAYDVMTNDRPYSKAISNEKALAEIESCAGSQFDPSLAQEFIKLKSINE